MGRPTDEELEKAIAKAIEMRESGSDEDFVAKALLNHHYRLGKAEAVVTAAGRYLHSGYSTTEHTKLVRALAEWHKLDNSRQEADSFGLE